MNEFTKGELEHLRFCVDTDIDIQGHHIYSMQNMLLSKIQSMIDNYCDHEPHGHFHVCVDKCKKCGVIIND